MLTKLYNGDEVVFTRSGRTTYGGRQVTQDEKGVVIGETQLTLYTYYDVRTTKDIVWQVPETWLRLEKCGTIEN